jgi:hypothetical protein
MAQFSIVLRSYWVLVVADQFTRRLAGFGAQCGDVTGNTPLTFDTGRSAVPVDLHRVRWVSHCRDLVQLPIAA